MININTYNPFKTAIIRKQLSKPTKILLNKGMLHGKILNYGCGYGEDTKILIDEFEADIVGYDKYNLEFDCKETLNCKYDVVICNYVFNVMPDLKEHEDVLQLLRKLGKDVYISVRSDEKAIGKDWTYDHQAQGYWTTHNTFQRFYDVNGVMVDILFGEVEYIARNKSMLLFRLK